MTALRAFDRHRELVASEGGCEFDTGDRIDDRFVDDLAAYPFEDVTETLDVPVAIFHGARDESVDVAHGFDAARELETDVLLQTFQAEGHLFSADPEPQLLDTTFPWLASVTC